MMTSYFRFVVVVLSLGIGFVAPTAFADIGGSSRPPDRPPADTDVTKGERAIKNKEWDRAVEYLTKAVARDDKNADAYNMLGYAERNRGNLDAAFKHYERALALDPKHRGAHEYVGEAYLMAGNLRKAEEHLARLDKLCLFSCSEYSDLKAAIAAYKQKHATGK